MITMLIIFTAISLLTIFLTYKFWEMEGGVGIFIGMLFATVINLMTWGLMSNIPMFNETISEYPGKVIYNEYSAGVIYNNAEVYHVVKDEKHIHAYEFLKSRHDSTVTVKQYKFQNLYGNWAQPVYKIEGQ